MPSAVRLRWSNRVKCLMCYLVCFALPLLWQAAASLWIYPLKLTGTAPNVALHLQAALPFSPAAAGRAGPVGEAAAATPEALLRRAFLPRAKLALVSGGLRARGHGCYAGGAASLARRAALRHPARAGRPAGPSAPTA